jgi:hypothetical protein
MTDHDTFLLAITAINILIAAGSMAIVLYCRSLLRRTRDHLQRIGENPALYDVARNVTHGVGMPWTDPRTGITHQPPGDKKP